jgi:ABC-type multidrug transport system ATPase subunit
VPAFTSCINRCGTPFEHAVRLSLKNAMANDAKTSNIVAACMAHDSRNQHAALEVRNLTVQMGGRLVLDGIDLCIGRAEIVVLLGANGAGKTTLVRCLAGLLQPTSGDLLWCGQTPRRTPRFRRLIGMVAHQPWLYGDLTTLENLLFAARMHRVRDPVARVEKLIVDSCLQPYAHRPAAELSQGVRQKISICRSLVHEPPILLLDEPLSGLDDRGREWLVHMVGELRAFTSICLTSHEAVLWQGLADRMLRLSAGGLYDETQTAFYAPRLRHVTEVAT